MIAQEVLDDLRKHKEFLRIRWDGKKQLVSVLGAFMDAEKIIQRVIDDPHVHFPHEELCVAFRELSRAILTAMTELHGGVGQEELPEGFESLQRTITALIQYASDEKEPEHEELMQ